MINFVLHADIFGHRKNAINSLKVLGEYFSFSRCMKPLIVVPCSAVRDFILIHLLVIYFGRCRSPESASGSLAVWLSHFFGTAFVHRAGTFQRLIPDFACSVQCPFTYHSLCNFYPGSVGYSHAYIDVSWSVCYCHEPCTIAEPVDMPCVALTCVGLRHHVRKFIRR